MPVAAIDGPDQYDFWSPGVWGQVEDRMLEAIGMLGNAGAHDAASRTAAKVARAVGDAPPAAPAVRRQEADARRAVSRPATTRSRTSLQGLAAMIAAGLPLRCVALEATGQYDTHAGQASALTPALTTTAASLYSFQRDLEARGVADRVLTLVWTEFGRRAEENGSGGTDHGAAGTGFLIGTRVAGTQVGEYPGLANGLDRDGNLKATSDFRGVYAALLEQWLEFDAERVLPHISKFKRPTLVK